MPPLLDVHGISKSFPGVKALRGVNLALGEGEVLAVIGENGAGKSTLMKILAGIQQPDEGEIRVRGQRVEIDSVRAAMRLGIALIHQELNLAENLDVQSNVYLGREPNRCGLVDRKRLRRDAERVLAQVGLDVSPQALVGSLSIGRQQMVEIAKALSQNARVLIMDEPTSSLSQHEAQTLFRVIGELRQQGVSIVYISHRLAEVRALADRVLVLRDGENAGELKQGQIDHENMVRRMVGRELSQFYARQPHAPGAARLAVKGLRTAAFPEQELNFEVRAGEIVGVAGLVGAGRTELLQALFGVEPALAGEIRVDHQPLKLRNPREAIAAGIALAPEDRKAQGLILEMAVRPNISLAGLWRQRLWGALVNRRREAEEATEMTRQLSIKTPGQLQPAKFLSGGNQQKIVLAKWLALKPKVLLLDEPTRGIDVGAKHEIYQLMEQLASAGTAILFVSSELEEILNLSDRTLVMHDGRLAGTLSRAELSEEAVMRLATGGVVHEGDRAMR